MDKTYGSLTTFFETYSKAMWKVKALLGEFLKASFTVTPYDICGRLQTSMLTPSRVISLENKEWLNVPRA